MKNKLFLSICLLFSFVSINTMQKSNVNIDIKKNDTSGIIEAIAIGTVYKYKIKYNPATKEYFDFVSLKHGHPQGDEESGVLSRKIELIETIEKDLK